MTKSQCYAEIAQKQSEIANYNTKNLKSLTVKFWN